jgi:hypothetical protein
MNKHGLAGRFQLPFSLLFSSSGGDEACGVPFARRKSAMVDGGRERKMIDKPVRSGDVMRESRRIRVGSARQQGGG